MKIWAEAKTYEELPVGFIIGMEGADAIVSPDQVFEWIQDLPGHRLIATYCTCRNEATSARAAQLLRSKGIDAVVLDGGLNAWKYEYFIFDVFAWAEKIGVLAYHIDSIYAPLKNILNFKNNISQSEKNTVKSERESNSSIMNTNQLVQEIKSVLDEKLSSEKMSKDTFAEESVASISSLVNQAIREKNEEYKQQLSSAKEEKAHVEAQHQELSASVEEMKQKLEAAEDKIRQFEEDTQRQEALARFNARMEAVEQDYELSEADLKIVASEVKELDLADEAFASYREKLAVVFAHKDREHIKAEKEKFDQAVSEAVEKRVTDMKETKASTEPEVVEEKVNLEEVLEEAEQVTPEISNTNEASSGETETLRTKFQSAFSKENINITY